MGRLIDLLKLTGKIGAGSGDNGDAQSCSIPYLP